MEDSILIDWLQFSAFITLDQAFDLLGMWDGWKLRLPSKLHYQFRAELGHISVHYTIPDSDSKYNPGVCIELTGQGCREYETYGRGDLLRLVQAILVNGWNCTRLDLAFDDFSGLIPLDQVVHQALAWDFVSISQAVEVSSSCSDGRPEHRGFSIYHGARSSRVCIRFYDKRVERKRWDLEHWVRCELQLRSDAAMGACAALQSNPVGDVFQGILHHYLEYKQHNDDDSNKSRWLISPWFESLIHGVSDISVISKKDVVYNQEKLYAYVIGQAGHAITAARRLWGDQKFSEYLEVAVDLPEKYTNLIEESKRLSEVRS